MIEIVKNPGVCGGAACLADTRIPVWVLVNARASGATDDEILQDYPTITQAHLDAAWAYAD